MPERAYHSGDRSAAMLDEVFPTASSPQHRGRTVALQLLNALFVAGITLFHAAVLVLTVWQLSATPGYWLALFFSAPLLLLKPLLLFHLLAMLVSFLVAPAAGMLYLLLQLNALIHRRALSRFFFISFGMNAVFVGVVLLANFTLLLLRFNLTPGLVGLSLSFLFLASFFLFALGDHRRHAGDRASSAPMIAGLTLCLGLFALYGGYTVYAAVTQPTRLERAVRELLKLNEERLEQRAPRGGDTYRRP